MGHDVLLWEGEVACGNVALGVEEVAVDAILEEVEEVACASISEEVEAEEEVAEHRQPWAVVCRLPLELSRHIQAQYRQELSKQNSLQKLRCKSPLQYKMWFQLTIRFQSRILGL